jgi:hypothetical protein
MSSLQDRVIILGRRPLLLAFLLGCGVSMLASGRLTLRLIVDGTLSFAFVPLCELVAYAVVYRLQRGTRSIAHPASASANVTADKEAGHYAQAADRYFAGNTPWLWWLVALMAAAAILPVRTTDLLPLVLMTSVIPIALSVRSDWRFFRRDGRTRARAAADVVLQRAIAWSLATAYFFGLAITSRDFFYLFVEMKDAVVMWMQTVL